MHSSGYFCKSSFLSADDIFSCIWFLNALILFVLFSSCSAWHFFCSSLNSQGMHFSLNILINCWFICCSIDFSWSFKFRMDFDSSYVFFLYRLILLMDVDFALFFFIFWTFDFVYGFVFWCVSDDFFRKPCWGTRFRCPPWFLQVRQAFDET